MNSSPLWKLNGQLVDYGEIPQLPPQAVERFEAKYLMPGPTACWLWVAARFRSGHGAFSVRLPDGRKATRKAHRVAWTLAHGPIPAGSHVLHTCGRPPCVNPAHLYLGDHSDNMADRWPTVITTRTTGARWTEGIRR